jgi:protein-disulfide isomerase
MDATPNTFRYKRFFRRVGIWGIGIGVLAGIGWGMVKLSSNVQLPTEGGTLSAAVTDVDDIRGPADAPITMVEYADFQCPACGSYYAIVKQLLNEPDVQGKVRLVHRDFPLTQLHANAQLSAQAAQAAAAQGKFWEMHDKLFETQSAWSAKSSAGARETFMQYAKDLGLDIARFTRDIDSAEVKARIQTDVESGLASGVSGTPTFFVNGSRMAQADSYQQFKELVLNSATPAK